MQSDPKETMMASQSQGIQQLLQAEKRAKDKLDEAKKRKGKRLKQAKEEAMAEINQFRMQKEKEFQEKQSLIMGSQSNLSIEIDEQTVGKIQNLIGNYNESLEIVMKQLLSMVCDLNPEIHKNYRFTD
ncbi:V-type proton ATPase subunit G 3 [Sminthopsis crassicaudata]|uniref:V-type proton ATPase subunit G 3 n=1 Tax=Sminthopsis crassicaudata TaxID=9301 RepID=UPI003D68E9AC